MVDLTIKGAHKYWVSFQDKQVYKALAFMDSVEKWTVDDNPKVREALDKFGLSLDKVVKFELKKEELYIKVGCYLRTSTVLRILQAIDTISPGAASRVLMYAEEKQFSGKNNSASLFIKRNIVFERLRLISRIFAPDRLKFIKEVLEKDYV